MLPAEEAELRQNEAATSDGSPTMSTRHTDDLAHTNPSHDTAHDHLSMAPVSREALNNTEKQSGRPTTQRRESATHAVAGRKRPRGVDNDDVGSFQLGKERNEPGQAPEAKQQRDTGVIGKVDVTPGRERLVLFTVRVSGPYIKVSRARGGSERHTGLDAARTEAPEGTRLRIADWERRPEDNLVQANEYLAAGTLEPLHPDDTWTSASLRSGSSSSCYHFSVTMKMDTLETAIMTHIADGRFGPITLVRFAADCYRAAGKEGPRVAPESSLGQLIKTYLAEDLQRIVTGEAYGYVHGEGGAILSTQLVEVFSEDKLAKRRSARRGGQVRAEGVE
ncbi:hypothetical protein LTR53_013386 [Teratosphaeriaceae sp. CCFEE 6253]|nr:hypothetical protein LTR53_013386 [Teratosphaeriaceae sp. CCFEE 6253]